MTTRLQRDLRRVWLEVAEANGAQLSSVTLTSGGHIRAIFTKGAASTFVIAGASPRCPSETRVIAAEAKRALRKLAQRGESPTP
jgi:hypothetical protein